MAKQFSMLALAFVALLWAVGMNVKSDRISGLRMAVLSRIEHWRWDSTSNYKVKIVSSDPLIMHLEDFITPAERTYLINLGKHLLRPSTVVDNHKLVASKIRTSTSAFLPYRDPIVRRIAVRATEFQGFMPRTSVDMQVTHYEKGQEYKPHFDWYPADEKNLTSNRKSTFFAILDASCSHCGTAFPEIPWNWTTADQRWCNYMDCDESVLTTRSVPGSAIYWENLSRSGEGIFETLHAGLPVPSGTKIGLNIWTYVAVKKPDPAKVRWL